jgi:Lon-like protease
MDDHGTVTTTDPDPGLEATGAADRRRHPWIARVAFGLVVVVVVAVLAGFAIHMDYTTIAPGEALSLPSRVTIQGAQSYSAERGDIRLLFVREANHVNLWRYLQARLDSDIDLVKDNAVNPGKLSPQQLNDQGLQAMADAKTAATSVALQAAGYKVAVAPGLVVHDLSPDMPAISVLHWGDVILSVDGKKIVAATDLNTAITKHKVGDDIALVVDRAGKNVDVSVKVGVFAEPAELKGHKGIGVSLLSRFTFPVKVSVDTTNIGGPSAGLAMSLAILDDLTPGNLTGGARIAVTGTIDAAGNVGEIGGIEQKAIAARAAGVTMFLVPQCSPDDPAVYLAACKTDLARATKRVGGKIKVVPVATFKQALQVLHSAGGATVTTTVPKSSTTIAA